jgi:hypothetical protein
MSIAELHALPSEEKLSILECLWQDFSTGGEPYVSPSWHKEELRKTEVAFEAGEIRAVDWDSAKKELLQQPR